MATLEKVDVHLRLCRALCASSALPSSSDEATAVDWYNTSVP